MPGTHYDNDHSFIEALQVNLRNAAYVLLRDKTLKQLTSFLDKPLDAIPFFSFKSNIDEKSVRLTIHACIIAKITAYNKAYIESHRLSLLESILCRSLSFFLGLSESVDKREVLLKLKNKSYKSYEWLISESDISSIISTNVNIRIRKGNSRRHFRHKVDVTYHWMRLGESEKSSSNTYGYIYSQGIDYFNPFIMNQLVSLSLSCKKSNKNLFYLKHNEEYIFFNLIFEKIELLTSEFISFSSGLIKSEDALIRLNEILINKDLFKERKEAKSTKRFVDGISDKFNRLVDALSYSLENSNNLRVVGENPFSKLWIDEVIGKQKKSSLNSELIVMLVKIHESIEVLENIYSDIVFSTYYLSTPFDWCNDYKDISESGFAFFSRYKVKRNDIILVHFMIKDNSVITGYQVLKLKSRVIRVENQSIFDRYLIAVEFIMPSEKVLNIIGYSVQNQELKEISKK